MSEIAIVSESVGRDVPAVLGERADLLAMLAKNRHFLRFTTRDITDEQAGRRTTASDLCLGGLIKHVALNGPGWTSSSTVRQACPTSPP
jgi:hypothetical protein